MKKCKRARAHKTFPVIRLLKHSRERERVLRSLARACSHKHKIMENVQRGAQDGASQAKTRLFTSCAFMCCMCTHTRTQTNTNLHSHKHAHMHIHTCTRTYMHAHARKDTHQKKKGRQRHKRDRAKVRTKTSAFHSARAYLYKHTQLTELRPG